MIKKCLKCGEVIKQFKETLTKNSVGIFMIRGECPSCDKWIKWVPYAESEEVEKALNLYYTSIENRKDEL